MENPVVLITGALTGIGRATAVAFAKRGARVVISGRRDEAGQRLLAELRGLDAKAEYVNADVRREEDLRNLVDKTVARFGRLDVAVNNAATEGKPGPVTEQSAESYAATFDTNVLGVLLSRSTNCARCCRAATGASSTFHRPMEASALRAHRFMSGANMRWKESPSPPHWKSHNPAFA